MRSLLTVGLSCLFFGCFSDHHVSPFPPDEAARQYLGVHDLEGGISQVRKETQADGLAERGRLDGTLEGGEPFVVFAYIGADAVGKPTHAVRVVTSAGIVLAAGPPDVRAPDPTLPCELIPSLQDGAYPSGVDLTGDGAPDVALRAEDGTIAIFRIDLNSAARYPVDLASPPTRADDVNGDGRPDLLGSPKIEDGDPIAPALVDVAIADRAAFRTDHPDAIAFHARLARTPPPAKDASKEAKLKTAIERAFHAMRAGTAPAIAIAAATDEATSLAPFAPKTQVAWVHWRGFLVDFAATQSRAEH